MKKILSGILLLLILTACNRNEAMSDAFGNFECEEIIVSSQSIGNLTSFPYEEGQSIVEGQLLAVADTTDKLLLIDELLVQKDLLEIKYEKALADQKLIHINLEKAEQDSKRYQILYSQNAIAKDILENYQHTEDLLQQQYSSSSLSLTMIEKEISQLQVRLNQAEREVSKSYIKSPAEGLLLAKYVEEGEFLTIGKPMFKIAKVSEIYLKAYVSQTQLSEIVLNGPVTILYDSASGMKELAGRITFISSQAEFTPKTIQTRDERANLVYGIKIKVDYDERIKIGMPAEVVFKS